MCRCLFWELDEDEDSLLQKEDLLRYGSYGLTSIVVERIWVLRHQRDSGGMAYDDFVYFLLAEEDKQSSPAYQYWFHVLDLNGDGALDQRDLGVFYDELRPRIEAMGEEVFAAPFRPAALSLRPAPLVPRRSRRGAVHSSPPHIQAQHGDMLTARLIRS